MEQGDAGGLSRPGVIGTSPADPTGRVHGFSVDYFRSCTFTGLVSGMAIGAAIGTVVALLPGALAGATIGAACGTVAGLLLDLLASISGYARGVREGDPPHAEEAREEGVSDPDTFDEEDRGELMRAVIAADTEQVKELVESGSLDLTVHAEEAREEGVSDPNTFDEEDRGELMRAVIAADTEQVKELVESGSLDLTVTDNDGMTPFLRACKDGSTEIAQLLYEHNRCVVTAKTVQEEDTALTLAAGEGRVETVRWLVTLEEYGVDKPDGENIWGRTALSCASQRGHINVVKHLLAVTYDAAGAINRFGKGRRSTPFIEAVRKGHTEIVALFLQYDLAFKGIYRVDGEERSPLVLASRGGHTDTVKLLLDCGSPIHVSNEGIASGKWSALNVAIAEGHIGVVRLLIHRGADVNPSTPEGSDPPIVIAARWGRTDIVRLLHTHGAVISSETLLRIEEKGFPVSGKGERLNREVKELFANDPVNRKGAETLREASRKGSVEEVEKALRDASIDPNAADPVTRDTALILAAQNGHEEIVQRLIRRSPDVDVTRANRKGCTALMVAAGGGHQKIVIRLAESDPEGVTRRSYEGRTALAYAGDGGHVSIASLLASRMPRQINRQSSSLAPRAE